MTTTRQQINGHWYLITTDDQGKIISIVADDPLPVAPPPPIQNKAMQAIQILKTGSATAVQQQQALAIVLALLLELADD